MNPQPATDMPPQCGATMRSLRSVHDPHPTRRHSAAPTALHPHQPHHRAEHWQVRALAAGNLQIGRPARPIAQVTAKLGVSWHPVTNAVPGGTQSRRPTSHIARGAALMSEGS